MYGKVIEKSTACCFQEYKEDLRGSPFGNEEIFQIEKVGKLKN